MKDRSDLSFSYPDSETAVRIIMMMYQRRNCYTKDNEKQSYQKRVYRQHHPHAA